VAALGKIGEEIERCWSARGYRRQFFHHIAADCLREAAFQQQFDEDEIIAWVNHAEALPLQLDPRSAFGQPPLTVWRTDRFVLDLYFWIDTETSAHDHSFSGAFSNLCGHSLNCTYRFERAARPDEGILNGALLLNQADYVRPGDVCPIVAGPKFIHRVWHLDCPTVTLVARTTKRPPRLRQYTYYSEGMAVQYRSRPPIEFQRRREFMGYLFRRRHPRRVALAEELLARARGWELFKLLGDLVNFYMKDTDDAEHLDDLIARLPARSRLWIETGLAVMRAAHPLTSVYWYRLRRTEHRLLIALLSTYTERQPALEWLARHGYAGDWRALLTGWLSEMDADNALRLHLGSARAEIITHLLGGLSDEEALGELRRTYTITESDADLLMQGFNRFRKLPFLRPLFVDTPVQAGAVRVASNTAAAHL
jgi:muconolactone delta-isomerase